MIYVTIGRLAGAALEKALSPLVVAEDNLLLGPARSGVERHRAARTRYWGSAPSREMEEHLGRQPAEAVCVVLPPTSNGLLSLCRVCAVALETGRDVLVMELGANTTATPSRGIDPAPESILDTRRLARRLPPAVRWSALETALAATVWRLWCRRSPVAFSRFCASGGPLHAGLANLGRTHAGFFPRVTERGLSVSRLDELILRQLSREWIAPARIYAGAVTRSPPLAAWLSQTGDLFLAARLLEWSNHSEGRIVERRRESASAKTEMLAWSFRWSAGAESILDQLPGLEVAPPLSIGGVVAYDPSRPWASRFDANGRPYLTRGLSRNGT